MQRVVITGGTGLIGKKLASTLTEKGYAVTILTRSKTSDTNSIKYSYWNPLQNNIDKDVLLNAHYIIHLAGAGIADKRWTKTRKEEIKKSRTAPIALIHSILSKNKNQLIAFISASGVGFYGATTSDTIFNETHQPATDFLGKTCVAWENAVDKMNNLPIRTVKLRTGMVLAKNGGAFPKIKTPFVYGVGAALGSGKQIMPWIHINDLIQLYFLAIEDDSINGAYNAVVENTTNQAFSEMLAKQLKKPLWLPNVPSFILKLIMGEMAVLLLEGSKIDNTKTKAIPYKFEFNSLEKALKTLL